MRLHYLLNAIFFHINYPKIKYQRLISRIIFLSIVLNLDYFNDTYDEITDNALILL